MKTNKTNTDPIWEPYEMDTITELDGDDFGTLYSVRMEHIGLTIAVYVTDDGEELYTSDWWTPQPRTVEEMADHEWITGDELAN